VTRGFQGVTAASRERITKSGHRKKVMVLRLFLKVKLSWRKSVDQQTNIEDRSKVSQLF